MNDLSAEEKKRQLEAYLQAVKGHGPQPGADILEEYLRPMTQEEMDTDQENFVEFCRDRHVGETIVLLGTGPSIRKLDLARLRRFTTIGCNGIGHMFYPDYYVILDPFIYGLHKEVFLACPNVRILSTFTRGECDIRIYYRYENLIGLSKDEIYSADSAGYVQLSMAYIMGAQRVVLAGYDGYKPGEESYHCYDEKDVEVNRVQYEWIGRVGVVKRDMIREAFAYAKKQFAEEGKGLYLLTDSYLLGDLLDRIGWEEFLRLPPRPETG